MRNTMSEYTLNPNSKWGRNPVERQTIVRELLERYAIVVTRPQLLEYIKSTNRTVNHVSWLLNEHCYKVGRGQYTLRPLLLESRAESSVSL